MDDKDFYDYLKNQDELSINDRAKRLKFLVETFGEPKYLAIPEMTYYYLDEARLCYLNGNYVACVLIVQASIEDILRYLHLFSYDERIRKSAKKANFNYLIEKSLEYGLIKQKEAECMHKTRRIRNPYVHTKTHEHPQSLIKRKLESDFKKNTEDLMKEDAEYAIICFFNLIKRYPLSF
jgi:hypothetical protein